MSTKTPAPIDCDKGACLSEELMGGLEAVLISTDRPVPSAKLAEMLGVGVAKAINAAVEQLNDLYKKHGRSFRVEQVAGGWQIVTLPQYAKLIAATQRNRQQTRLSPAALEALAIIAYKQPVLRAEIEAIRGVSSGEILRGLMDRTLVKIVGRAEELGRPMLYGTTKSFLELFGMASLKDLPKPEELKLNL